MACSLPQQPPDLSPAIYAPFTDYSQWERRPQKSPDAFKASLSGRAKGRPRVLLNVVASSTSGRKGTNRHNGSCLSARGGTVIVRSRPQEERKAGSRPMSHRSESAARLRYLRMQVSGKKESVEDVHQYKQELLSMNLSLINDIQTVEHGTHSDVDKMLEKYSKFKGAISRLKIKSSEQLQKAKEELDDTRAKLEEDISELHKTVSNTERLFQRKSRELNVLLSYKEKEFPLKVVRIDQLKEQCELLKERQEAELMDLELQIAEEWDRCGQTTDAVRKDLETKATEASLANMKRSVHEKAIQNRIMEKELTIHHKKRSELQEAVATLSSNVKRLKELASKKHESRHQLPISKLGKCTPSTELYLDFPRLQHFTI